MEELNASVTKEPNRFNKAKRTFLATVALSVPSSVATLADNANAAPVSHNEATEAATSTVPDYDPSTVIDDGNGPAPTTVPEYDPSTVIDDGNGPAPVPQAAKPVESGSIKFTG